MKKYLVISEVSKKQGYIYKTNKLKENIGASTIIEYVTEDLPKSIGKSYNTVRSPRVRYPMIKKMMQ